MILIKTLSNQLLRGINMNNFVNQGSGDTDALALKLKKSAFMVLTVVFGLLPLFFIPLPAAPFGYSKILFVIVGLALALILYSLYVLRVGSVSVRFPHALTALWAVFLVSLVSTLLSGDFKDAFIGDTFSIHSTAFLGVLALSATVWVLLSTEKSAIMRLYFLFAVSAVVLVVFHVIRLFLGAGALDVGVFTNNVSTPIGGWNDLALFLGLTILLSLVALEQLPLTAWGRRFFGIVAGIALVMLAIINFIYVWVVLALISLVMLIYTIRRPRQKTLNQAAPDTGEPSNSNASLSSLTLSLVVFAVSVFFLVGGSTIGGFMNDLTGISFIEVRPSFESTTNVAGEVYKENAFLGIGSNKFSDAWRQHKNSAINNTIFWNTEFNAGSGYIPTFFITNGVLGGVAWIVFLAMFLLSGMRMLVKTANTDRLWYFVGVSSFAGAVYIWGMSIVYVPGPAVLLLGALCTGIAFLAYNTLSAQPPRTFAIGDDRRTGFIFTFLVIVIIIGSIGVLYTGGRHYAAAYTFNDSVLSIRSGTSLDEIEAKIVRAHELSENDLYVRRLAEYQLARMNTLFSVESPNETQQQQFNQALSNGVNAAQLAIEADNTEPANWAVQGQIYSLLVSANVEGAYERALEALERARDLDPKNPSRYLALANLEARAGNFAEAKTLAESAIQRKSNYSDAFFFLTQLAVATGDVDAATESARAVISLEPRNPARYYQLGVLESSRGDLEAAAAAFEQAIRLDNEYANAMYFLALTYDALDRSDEAEQLLERVLELNPGNANVTALLEQLESNGTLNADIPQTEPVGDTEASVSEESGVVTTDEDPDSSLVTPVNVAPDSSGDSSGDAADEESQNEETTGDSAATESDETETPTGSE